MWPIEEVALAVAPDIAVVLEAFPRAHRFHALCKLFLLSLMIPLEKLFVNRSGNYNMSLSQDALPVEWRTASVCTIQILSKRRRNKVNIINQKVNKWEGKVALQTSWITLLTQKIH